MNRSLYSSDVFTDEFKDEEGEEKLVPESWEFLKGELSRCEYSRSIVAREGDGGGCMGDAPGDRRMCGGVGGGLERLRRGGELKLFGLEFMIVDDWGGEGV
mmetsp:Transcript_20477/g.38181  ORF Transcript_20477/g.38181 Transcript_20477/m.38181 type:complete len:101 (-) Transcript_20477:91-393(-)